MGWRALRNLAWSLGVLAVLAGLAFGLPAVNAAIPAAQAVSADRPYQLGYGVTVLPPPGAQLDVTKSGPGSALFVLAEVRYLLVVTPFPGTLEQATDQLRHRITANRGYQVTGAETSTRTNQGVAGRQGGYTSPGRNGRYAVFLARGVSVQVSIAGADLDLRQALPALTGSVASIAFPGTS
jgi:hypothetical protein